MDDRLTIAAIIAAGIRAGSRIVEHDGGVYVDTSPEAVAKIACDDAAAILDELNKDSPAPAEDCPPPLHDAAGAGDVVEHQVGELNDGNATIIRAAPAAKWGRVADPGAAWHLWREGAGEAECGESTEAELEFLPVNTGMDPETVCLDCKDIDVQAHLAAAPAIHARPLPRRNRCAGFNKSAGVACNTLHVHFERGGKWFCKRHDPEKPKKVKAQEVAA